MHGGVVSPGSPAYIAYLVRPSKGYSDGLASLQMLCIVSFSERTGPESRLALTHTLEIYPLIERIATCIQVVLHSLRNIRLSCFLVFSVGTLLV